MSHDEIARSTWALAGALGDRLLRLLVRRAWEQRGSMDSRAIDFGGTGGLLTALTIPDKEIPVALCDLLWSWDSTFGLCFLEEAEWLVYGTEKSVWEAQVGLHG